MKRLLILVTAILLVGGVLGFKCPETMYAKTDIECFDGSNSVVAIIPIGTELSVFETNGEYSRVSYLTNNYVFVKTSDIVNFDEMNKINQEWRMNTLIEDNTDKSDIILIGDSRTYQMHRAVGTLEQKVSWIAQPGAGYKWLEQVVSPIIDETNVKGKTICILTGVNDVIYKGNDVSFVNYDKFMNGKVIEWQEKGAKIVFISINPCNGSYDIYNAGIDLLNNNIKSILPKNVSYIDTNSVLKLEPLRTVDGVHYDERSYEVIYSTILNNLN